jgi:hypothetical protein
MEPCRCLLRLRQAAPQSSRHGHPRPAQHRPVPGPAAPGRRVAETGQTGPPGCWGPGVPGLPAVNRASAPAPRDAAPRGRPCLRRGAVSLSLTLSLRPHAAPRGRPCLRRREGIICAAGPRQSYPSRGVVGPGGAGVSLSLSLWRMIAAEVRGYRRHGPLPSTTPLPSRCTATPPPHRRLGAYDVPRDGRDVCDTHLHAHTTP